MSEIAPDRTYATVQVVCPSDKKLSTAEIVQAIEEWVQMRRKEFEQLKKHH